MKLEARQRYSPPSRSDTLARRRRASASTLSLIQDCGDKRPGSGMPVAAPPGTEWLRRSVPSPDPATRAALDPKAPRQEVGDPQGMNGAVPARKAAWRRRAGTSQQRAVVPEDAPCLYPPSTTQSMALAGNPERPSRAGAQPALPKSRLDLL